MFRDCFSWPGHNAFCGPPVACPENPLLPWLIQYALAEWTVSTVLSGNAICKKRQRRGNGRRRRRRRRRKKHTGAITGKGNASADRKSLWNVEVE